MNWWTYLQQLTSASYAPWLPAAGLAQVGLWLGWAVLLAVAAAGLSCRLTVRLRWAVVCAVMAWTLAGAVLWPPYSPAYWLGLAFQSPSLFSVLLGLRYLAHAVRFARGSPDARFDRAAGAPVALMVAGGLLGWVLLADLLAWWPVSLYAWGFSPAALASVSAVALIWWLVCGGHTGAGKSGLTLLAVMGLFVLTRLPSGNVWDALMDPWLWIGLNGLALRWGWRAITKQQG